MESHAMRCRINRKRIPGKGRKRNARIDRTIDSKGTPIIHSPSKNSGRLIRHFSFQHDAETGIDTLACKGDTAGKYHSRTTSNFCQ